MQRRKVDIVGRYDKEQEKLHDHTRGKESLRRHGVPVELTEKSGHNTYNRSLIRHLGNNKGPRHPAAE